MHLQLPVFLIARAWQGRPFDVDGCAVGTQLAVSNCSLIRLNNAYCHNPSNGIHGRPFDVDGFAVKTQIAVSNCSLIRRTNAYCHSPSNVIHPFPRDELIRNFITLMQYFADLREPLEIITCCSCGFNSLK